eukprot:6104340-Pyramimonas_sp.AAC.1
MQENDLEAESSRMKLALHLVLLTMNTDHLEVKQSHIRRFTTKRVQCRQEDTMGLSGKWLANQVRLDPCGLSGPASSQPRRADRGRGPSRGAAEEQGQDAPGPGGGAWRAFVRRMGMTDLSRVGELYRAAKAAVGDE